MLVVSGIRHLAALAAIGPALIAGNPGSHYPVPAAAHPVPSNRPAHVVGTGTPTSCTSAALVRDVAAGGVITFDCGSTPVTINMAATAVVTKTSPEVVIDGGGLITLSGEHRRRILYSDTCAGTPSTDDCYDQPDPRIVVQNITFTDGEASTRQTKCQTASPACDYGGGAIFAEGGQFKSYDTAFIDNRCYADGPDLGGGAIRVLAQYRGRPVYIAEDTFSGGRCSNGAALSSIGVSWDVINSVFSDNDAIGDGANPAAAGTPGGGSGGAIYLDGDNDSTLIAGTIMRGNRAREGGGAVFDVVDAGSGALTFDQSRLSDNPSGQFQNAPGIFYERDGKVRAPTEIRSSIS